MTVSAIGSSAAKGVALRNGWRMAQRFKAAAMFFCAFSTGMAVFQ